MDDWKKSFSQKLGRLRSNWVAQFDELLESVVTPVVEDLGQFLSDNGFRTSKPLRENGRRSFKFELAEDAYVLLILRSIGLGAFELSCETVVPGSEPVARKSTERLAELSKAWAMKQIQAALNAFVDRLSGGGSAKVQQEEPVAA